jgi:hypothetical protein
MNAEEAIATSGTIALASVDMSYIRRIDEMFNSDKDPLPLSSPKQVEPEPTKTLLEKLNKQGINLISETDYALATINISQGKPAYTFVLFGRFSRDKLKQAIRQHYLVDESVSDYLLIEKLPEQAKKDDPCAKPSTRKLAPIKQALHIQNGRILLSSPELMPILLKCFAEKARAGVSLEKWRQFRNEKAIAGALMSPKEEKKGAVDLLLGALSNQPLKDVYAGAVVSLLPTPGFTFLIDAHSNKAEWPHEIKTKYDAWIKEAVDDLKEMPTLTSLIQTLSVQADGNVLRFKTIANRKTLENVEKIPGEFLQMAFPGIFDVDKKGRPADAEQIVKDSEVEKYTQHFNFSFVQPFDDKNVFHKPDYLTGPFAVRLKKIGLLEIDNAVV